ncbi:MAG: Abi family protein [Desulfobulbaceae bacterium]|jgi:abortive infection bacteriophage resistance protein
MTVFNKPSLSIPEHIDQWRKRGLLIPDRSRAERYLSVISYYRLSAYSLPFQTGNPDDQFKPGCEFEDILGLYVFDRQLRLLILDAIERIEVALRTRMTNVLATHHGPHAYLDPNVFDTRYDHLWLLEIYFRVRNLIKKQLPRISRQFMFLLPRRAGWAKSISFLAMN